MPSRHNRVLWLLNHETLKDFEVPLLRKLGYEVYLPKIFPKTEEYSSCSIDVSCDAFLTIPKEDLEILNKHDFYTEKMGGKIKEIVNSYFSVAFFGMFANIAAQMVEGFSGQLFLRGYGLAGDCSYSRIALQYLSSGFTDRLHAICERFCFAMGYSFLLEQEEGIFHRKAAYLPIGIPPSFFSCEDSWKGEEEKLLFVCPRITTQDYYRVIYENFKKRFSHIPHLIGGRQLFSIEDPAILGALPREQYYKFFQTSRVMFYHSEERRHVHYHPLEAIVFGLPLIYMHKGLLGRLAGEKLPGACDTFEEAEEKIQRVIRGDISFTHEVKTSQKKIIDTMRPDHCYEVWRKYV